MTYKESDQMDALGARHPIPALAIGCFRDRLKKAMGNRAARVFSRDSGLSEGAIRSYLSGETYPTLDRLEQIAQAAGVSALWLAFGASPEGTDEDGYTYVPMYDGRCTPGIGSWPIEAKLLTRLAFETDSLKKQGLEPEYLSAIRVDGDSMVGVLSDGDTVLIDHSRNSLEGEAVYVIRLDDHLYPKRLQRLMGGGVAVISANVAYPMLTVAKEDLDALEIVGRVVWASGWL